MLRGCGASLGPSSLAAAAAAGCQAGELGRQDGLLACLGQALLARGLASAGTPSPTRSPSAPSAAATLTPAGAPAQASGAAASGNEDPDANLPLDFSLRPSVLSPLFSTWQHATQAWQRRDHLVALLNAHQLLAKTPIRERTERGVARVVLDRVKSMDAAGRQLVEVLDDTLTQNVPPACPTPAMAAAYCTALELAATRADPAAREFAAVQRGAASPFDHFARHFVGPFSNTPRLEPLDVIFSKHTAADAAALPSGSRGSDKGLLGSGSGRGGPHIDMAGVTHAKGKRKASSASLQLVPGSGSVTVNGLPVASYFRDLNSREHALQPLLLAGDEGAKYDIAVDVRGGGASGQAQAVRTAIARALCVQRPALAEALGPLTRWDGRVVERKKPGREKARRGFQWVKR
ncbi:hypothetical protein HYH03_008555 [Edaphochlamys debaryana]|uniref:Small ribosomal subunit protein uS9c n=1 Tax=Edaphochlamys debaryana TaxID=47281 RepID=A0A835Y8T5_9CHLO|nr:hypothetical protein HYH03_008555 [Edaphochlamys debaryana]|eukprot:KAG2493129.1 hypothetical protein HYH03_008555 [Edaphochlamys debaryana]